MKTMSSIVGMDLDLSRQESIGTCLGTVMLRCPALRSLRVHGGKSTDQTDFKLLTSFRLLFMPHQ